MNYLIQKWSQVQNDHKNAMTIDISELTINVLMLMKSRSLHDNTKKSFLNFLTVTWQPFMKYHSPPSFLSSNITKNAETHSPPMRDVIIEQPLYQIIDLIVWSVVQQENVNLYQFLLWRKKTDISWIRFWPYIFSWSDLQNSIWLNFMEVLHFKTDHNKP